ncbi:hypothetical protein HDU81_003350 [Chytriomyces hyalinus]|nr:hypothetical protein HDU81_003350 [Chytriomyces hyalinus]
MAEMEEFLALMDTWPIGPDFPHRDNWLLEPRDVLDDDPYTPQESSSAAESERVPYVDGYKISYQRSSLLSAGNPYSVSTYHATDCHLDSRDQTRNLISRNPFASWPKGMGECHVLPIESDVAIDSFQTATGQCELETKQEKEVEGGSDPQEAASDPSTILDIQTLPLHQQDRITAQDEGLLSTPKNQQRGGIFNWIHGLFSCFGFKDLPPIETSVAPATITTPLCATPAIDYGTTTVTASPGIFVGLLNGESGGDSNSMTAGTISKRRHLHWLCDASGFE